MLTHTSSSDRTGHRSPAADDAETGGGATRRAEEIHIRNFDVRRSYDLTVEVHEDCRPVFADRYHLPPGQTASELGRLPPGEYEVTVELDGLHLRTARCRIDGTPERTALIQVGNGTVSVREGLYQ